MKILLIEPDRVLSKTLHEALENQGHVVTVRSTAQGALDGVDAFKPDVAILEVQLDKHNGVEFLYELRSHADWMTLPVLVHTANQDALNHEFEAGWKELGVRDVLYKPRTTLEKLNKAISKLA
jgi:DNA-binding response OmpR family regulator